MLLATICLYLVIIMMMSSDFLCFIISLLFFHNIPLFPIETLCMDTSFNISTIILFHTVKLDEIKKLSAH